MEIKNYEITWVMKYLFPSVFIILFVGSIFMQPWPIFNLNQIDISELGIFIGELIVLFFAFYCLTVQYSIANNTLIIRSFLFHRRIYDFESIKWIDEDGIYHFLCQTPIGVDLTILTLKNGKRIRIIGLKKPLKFIQEIRSYQISKDE